jgi:hypothetical protein
VSLRNWPSTVRGGIVARQDGVEQAGDLLLGHGWKLTPRAARELHVDQRLDGAQADAADLDDVGVELVLREVGADRASVLPAPAPRPQVPAPTKIAGRDDLAAGLLQPFGERRVGSCVAVMAPRSTNQVFGKAAALTVAVVSC